MDLLQWDDTNYAANLFGVRRGQHYNIPKPKFLFYIDFKMNPAGMNYINAADNDRRLGFMVKSADRPSVQYQQQELNQYNRKRLVTTGVSYGSMSYTFHDTIDSPALRMFKDYSAYYYHDFRKNASDFGYDVVNGVNHTTDFGYSPKNNGSDIYFFSSIDFYEFYNGYYTMYQLMNPKFESVSFSSADMQSSEGQDVTITVKPEGIVWSAITQPITEEVSHLVGLPFKTGTTGNFRPVEPRIPGTGLNTGGPNTAGPGIQIGGMGSFVGNTLGNIFGGLISNVANNILSPGVNNFLSNSGLSFLQPAANSLIGFGAANLTNTVQTAIGRIF